MSLNILLGNSLSALQTNQAALTTTSNNIANVNTPGYARRVVETQTATVAGSGAGVEISQIRRVVDNFLEQEGWRLSGEAGRYDLETRYHDRIQSLLGAPDSETSLSARIATALASAGAASGDAASSVRRTDLLNDLARLTESFAELGTSLQQMRSDADRDLAARIDSVNADLRQVSDLNREIARVRLTNGDSSALEDQRGQVLSRLSEVMDIRIAPQDDGTYLVSTRDGFQLADTGYTELSYTASSAVTPDTTFGPITAQRYAASGQVLGAPQNITERINGGELRALIHLRDSELPRFGADVGALAGSVADALNAVHNNSVAVPAPSILEGRNTGLQGTDSLGFTGATSLAVTDANGALVSRIDIDFSAGTLSVDGGAPAALGGTIASFTAALNTALGGNGTASFVAGQLTVSATGGNGLGFVQDAANPSDRGGRGLSHFFGLNDLVQASGPFIGETGLSAADAHGFTPGDTITLQARSADGSVVRERTITIAGTSFADILSSLNDPATGFGGVASFALDAGGKLTVTPTGSGDLDLHVREDTTARAGSGAALSTLFGFGDGALAKQALGFALDDAVAGNPSRLALAQVSLEPATVAGDIVLGRSDNRGAVALQAIAGQTFSFGRAGHQGATTGTLSELAAAVLAGAGSRAAEADGRSQSAAALSNEIEARKAEVSGVNLDEELSNMMVFQQAYQASARMLQVAQEVYDTLLQLV